MIYNQIAKLKVWQRNLILIFIDLSSLVFAVWLSFWLRLSDPYSSFFQNSLWIIPVICCVAIPVYITTGYYRGLLSYTTSTFIYRSSISVLIITIGTFFIGTLFNQSMPPISIWPLSYIITFGSNGIIRIVLRDYVRSISSREEKIQNVVVYGAGSAGAQLINSLRTVRNYRIKFIVDDNKKLWGRNIGGVKIYSPEYLNKTTSKINNVLLAIPTISLTRRRQIINNIQKIGFSILKVPSIEEIADGRAQIENLRRIDIEDLLERDVVEPIPELLQEGIRDKVILITGAGGSIGSEISSQIIKMNPNKLILVDINEKNLYELINHLEKHKISKKIKYVLGDTRDFNLMRKLIDLNSVDLIFHT